MQISCIIVAGGKSSRMGYDKKFIELNGSIFLEYAIRAAEKIADEIIIVVGSNTQKDETRRFTHLKIAVDKELNRGPVMGILTGLENCSHNYAAVMPVDTPLINPEIYKYMISLSHSFDAVIPKDGEHIEPMHAIYHVKTMTTACKKALKKGEESAYLTVKYLKKVMFVPVEELRKFDENLMTFRSVNTPEDVKKLKEMLKGR